MGGDWALHWALGMCCLCVPVWLLAVAYVSGAGPGAQLGAQQIPFNENSFELFYVIFFALL